MCKIYIYAFNIHIVIFILHEYSLLLDVAKRSSVKEADAEEVVKKWLKAASDCQGGRQRRLEKKQGMRFLFFSTFPHFSPLFTTFLHFSPLFPTWLNQTRITQKDGVLVVRNLVDTSDWSARVLLIYLGSDLVVLPVLPVSTVLVTRTLVVAPEANRSLPEHLEDIVTRVLTLPWGMRDGPRCISTHMCFRLRVNRWLGIPRRSNTILKLMVPTYSV